MIHGPLGAGHPSFADARPFADGMMETGGIHRIYWETCGNPAGKPVLVLHGGPGSGATAYWRQFFDPARYFVILFDQRGCGRSTPHAGDTVEALAENTTAHLIGDIEGLRALFDIEKWMLFGGSWGSTLALSYAVSHPERVAEMILWAVVTTRSHEIQWFTHGMGQLFPQEFEAFTRPFPGIGPADNIPLLYNRLLTDPDPAVHMPASRAWCAWEDRVVTLRNEAAPSARYGDDRFRLGFARLVTHYFGNYAFQADDFITGRIQNLAEIPLVMVRGRMDIASPLTVAWKIHRALPRSDLYVLDDAGHGGAEAMHQILLGAARYFSR